MSYPGIIRRLFANDGAGSVLREDILPDRVKDAPLPGTAAPKAPGTAAAGTSANYAREDHTHPAQTAIDGNAKSADTAKACTGNAATATKLATARTIQTNLASTAADSFDGSGNITPGVTGVLPIANGGTGATTAEAARKALGISDTAGAPLPTAETGMGQWRPVSGRNLSNLTVPAGGTWAYYVWKAEYPDVTLISSYSGVAAGGTVIVPAVSGKTYYFEGFFWRIS